MRTTLTLDEDVAAKLREEMAKSGTTFKETVNVVLRRGLEAPTEKELARPFRIEARSMGLRPGLQLDDVAGLLDLLDGAARR